MSSNFWIGAIIVVACVLIVLGFSSCDNTRVKYLGGTMNVDLDPGQKLEVTTWKEGNFWYLTRPMRDGECAERHVFQEKSMVGLLNGKVVLQEHDLVKEHGR